MKTFPMRVGAPLEPGTRIAPPHLAHVRAEILRCEVELIYAIAQHRRAWAKMRSTREIREEKAAAAGIPVYLDNDPNWKVATGDVTWWRGEMEAQAAIHQALLAIEARLTGK